MSPQIFTREWIDTATAAVLKDPDFHQRLRAFTASVQVRDEKDAFTMSFGPDGNVKITQGDEAKADFLLQGTRQQWDSALNSARDLGGASGHGLSLTGDQVSLDGHAVGLSRLWLALQGKLPVEPSLRDRAYEPAPLESPTEEVIGRYVQVGNYRTYYESAGVGRPVVCIHSGGADGREYRSLVPHLAALGYKAIALDFPGHGKSYPNLTDLEPIRSKTEWIEFLLAFSAKLDLDRPIYVGCAMSASLLLELAAEHPEAAGAIVSAIGTVDYTDGLSAEFLDALNHPQVNVSDFLQAVTPGLIGANLPVEARNEATWHNARNLTPEVMDADLRIYATHNVRSRLHKIHVPVLHIRSEFDSSVRDQDVEAIAADVPSATLVHLPGVGHLPMVEDPDQFNSTVEGFLNTLEGAHETSSADSAITQAARS